MAFPIRRKYNNKWTTYRKVRYHSRLEAAFAKYLDVQKKERKITKWSRQERVDCCVNGVHICSLIVDFLVTHSDGAHEYIEIKGMETDVWKLKHKLLKALYPTIHYTVYKAKDLKKLNIKTT